MCKQVTFFQESSYRLQGYSYVTLGLEVWEFPTFSIWGKAASEPVQVVVKAGVCLRPGGSGHSPRHLSSNSVCCHRHQAQAWGGGPVRQMAPGARALGQMRWQEHMTGKVGLSGSEGEGVIAPGHLLPPTQGVSHGGLELREITGVCTSGRDQRVCDRQPLCTTQVALEEGDARNSSPGTFGHAQLASRRQRALWGHFQRGWLSHVGASMAGHLEQAGLLGVNVS